MRFAAITDLAKRHARIIQAITGGETMTMKSPEVQQVINEIRDLLLLPHEVSSDGIAVCVEVSKAEKQQYMM